MTNLYIIATPIGNLEDITKRALRILSEVDLILCEDTRVTRKLLNYFKIEKPTQSYHQHSKLKKIEKIINLLESGKNLALVSDAGTPGISDPGNKLIEEITNRIPDKVKIIPVPGPSAVAACCSISGFAMDEFLFLGFPPAKRKRNKFFNRVKESEVPVVLYESRYRVIKTLNHLKKIIPARKIVIGRELTKKFESIYRGSPSEVIAQLEKDKIKGEFTIIVNSPCER